MRKTKAQIEADGKAKLRQRIMDIALGANGGSDPDTWEESGIYYSMGPCSFFGFVRAIKATFPAVGPAYELWNLHHFVEIDTAVEHLWEYGVRE